MGRRGGKGGNNNQDQGGKDNQEGVQSVLDFTGKDSQVLSHLQKRLGNLIGQSSGYLEGLPKVVQTRIKALKHLHSKHSDLEKQFNAEVLELEKKYRALYAPLYDRRSDIVLGKAEPTPEELVEPKKEDSKEEKKEEKKQDNKSEKEEDVKGIPEFWLTALKHHPDFGAMITDRDEEALKHLTDIKIGTVATEPHSFSIEFHFSDNPVFEDPILKKTYILKEVDAEVVYDHVDATEIKWKPGKNLTIKKITKQQKPKGGRRGGRGGSSKGQTITVEQPCESFFNFFNPEQAFEIFNGMMVGEDEDAEGMEEPFQDFLEMDYEMGLELKDKLIPHAVMWFTGEAALNEYGDDDLEDDDEFDEEDEDEENEEDFAPPQQQQQSGNQQQPECKQQ